MCNRVPVQCESGSDLTGAHAQWAAPPLGPGDCSLGPLARRASAWESGCAHPAPRFLLCRRSACPWASVLGWRRRWTSARRRRSPARGRTSRPGAAASPSRPTSGSACWSSGRTTSCSRRASEWALQPCSLNPGQSQWPEGPGHVGPRQVLKQVPTWATTPCHLDSQASHLS